MTHPMCFNVLLTFTAVCGGASLGKPDTSFLGGQSPTIGLHFFGQNVSVLIVVSLSKICYSSDFTFIPVHYSEASSCQLQLKKNHN